MQIYYEMREFNIVADFDNHNNIPLSSLYWDVCVFKDKREMLSFAKKMKVQIDEPLKRSRACVVPSGKVYKAKKFQYKDLAFLGWIMFIDHDITPEIISHESVHCACIHIARSTNIKDLIGCKDSQEHLAYLVGNYTQQITTKLVTSKKRK